MSCLESAVGKWTGESTLHMSWLEGQKEFTSQSDLSIRELAPGGFYLLEYTWVEEGKTERGSLHISESAKLGEVQASFLDTWHMPFPLMYCKGTFAGSSMNFTGSYPAGDGSPDWGWRFEIEMNPDDTLGFRMINISPDGEEEWAVRAVYSRVL